jgi:hypothetical protein
MPFQGLPNYIQIGIFGFENIPSGNPGEKGGGEEFNFVLILSLTKCDKI